MIHGFDWQGWWNPSQAKLLFAELILGENDEIPELNGVTMEDTVEVAPGGCTFFVL